MIVTFTANPSIDRTITLNSALVRGEVQRAASTFDQAAGKGVNVALVVAAAGQPVVAVLPFRDESYERLLVEHTNGSPFSVHVPPDGARCRARTNTTITEPDGTTTKVNEPGPQLSASDLATATATLVQATTRGASWLVMSGSLPPGAPPDWYARIARAVKPWGCKVAIDTSDAALDAVVAALPEASFDLLKPNSDELAQLTGGDAAAFEAEAAAGNLTAIVDAARTLYERGIANVLVTLGGAGAVLVNAEGAWHATAPKVTLRSTVGAGDSSVAGFVLADVAGKDPAGCLASAVAHGSAAASLPGTTLPTPDDLPAEAPVITQIF